LGTGGHCRCGWDTIANADTESYAKSDGYACCLWAVSNTNAHSYCNIHPNANSYSYSNTNRNGHSHSHLHTHTEVCADSEASSHTAAATIEIFAVANISSYPPPRNRPWCKAMACRDATADKSVIRIGVLLAGAHPSTSLRASCDARYPQRERAGLGGAGPDASGHADLPVIPNNPRQNLKKWC
jgi:hypothetical protein